MTPIDFYVAAIAFGCAGLGILILTIQIKPRKRYERPEDFVVLDGVDVASFSGNEWPSDRRFLKATNVRELIINGVRFDGRTGVPHPSPKPYSDEDGIVMSAEPAGDRPLDWEDGKWS